LHCLSTHHRWARQEASFQTPFLLFLMILFPYVYSDAIMSLLGGFCPFLVCPTISYSRAESWSLLPRRLPLLLFGGVPCKDSRKGTTLSSFLFFLFFLFFFLKNIKNCSPPRLVSSFTLGTLFLLDATQAKDFRCHI